MRAATAGDLRPRGPAYAPMIAPRRPVHRMSRARPTPEVDMPLAGVEQAKRPTARIELVLVMGKLRQDVDEDVGD